MRRLIWKKISEQSVNRANLGSHQLHISGVHKKTFWHCFFIWEIYIQRFIARKRVIVAKANYNLQQYIEAVIPRQNLHILRSRLHKLTGQLYCWTTLNFSSCSAGNVFIMQLVGKDQWMFDEWPAIRGHISYTGLNNSTTPWLHKKIVIPRRDDCAGQQEMGTLY